MLVNLLVTILVIILVLRATLKTLFFSRNMNSLAYSGVNLLFDYSPLGQGKLGIKIGCPE